MVFTRRHTVRVGTRLFNLRSDKQCGREKSKEKLGIIEQESKPGNLNNLSGNSGTLETKNKDELAQRE